MIRATLHTFNWKERRVSLNHLEKQRLTVIFKVYQLNMHTIHVLDESKLEIEPFSAQPSGGNFGILQSNLHASDAIAGVQLGKRAREEDKEA